MFRDFIKENYVPILILIALPILFFYKLLLNPSEVLYPASDILNDYSVWKNYFVQNFLTYGKLPLWNGNEFSGTPFIANPSSGMLYPFTLIFFLLPVDIAFGYAFILDLILLGGFTYLYSKSIGLGKIGALFSSIAITFSGTVFSRIYPGHLFILDTFVWFPFVLYLFEKGLRSKAVLYGLLSSIPISLMFFSGNPQIALYSLFTAFLYIFTRPLFEEDRQHSYWKAIRVFVLGIFFGILLSASQVLPILEFSSLSSRGGGVDYFFASSFSLPIKKIISFVFPFLFGSPIDNSYWGLGNFWEFCGYMGVTPLFFAVLSLLIKNNKYVKLFFFIFMVSFLFSLGKYGPLFDFFYNYVPFFNLFRAPSRFLFFYAFAIAVLSGFGVNALIRKKIQKIGSIKFIKFAYILTIISFISTLISIIVYSRLVDLHFLFEDLVLKNRSDLMVQKDALYGHAISSFLLSSTFFFLSAIILLAFFKKSKNLYLGYAIIFIVTVELFLFDRNFVSTQNRNIYYKTPHEIDFIKKNKETFRIFDFNTGLYSLAQRKSIENITGYNPTFISYYREYVWKIGSHRGNKSDSFIELRSINDFNRLRRLNVKYILSKNIISNNNLKLVYKDKYYVYELSKTLPRAYLIDNRSRITPVVERKVNSDKMTISFDSKIKQRLILSEIWYPGWEAYDNGKRIEIDRFDIFRSFQILPGKHNIEMTYKSSFFEIGKWVTGASIVTVLLTVLFLIKNKNTLKKLEKFSIKF